MPTRRRPQLHPEGYSNDRRILGPRAAGDAQPMVAHLRQMCNHWLRKPDPRRQKGSRRPMVVDRIERDILIDAPQTVVWQVITEPDQIARWFVDAAQVDLRPGGAGTFVFHSRATHTRATVALVVESVDPPHRFAFRWAHPPGAEPREGNSLHVEFTLQPEGDRTRLRLVERGFAALEQPEADRMRSFEEHNAGWHVHLGNLQAYAAHQAASPQHS